MVEICRVGQWWALVRICPADPRPYIIPSHRQLVARLAALALTKARLICANKRSNPSDVLVARLLVHPVHARTTVWVVVCLFVSCLLFCLLANEAGVIHETNPSTVLAYYTPNEQVFNLSAMFQASSFSLCAVWPYRQ